MILHGAIRTSARSLLRLATERDFRRLNALSLRFALRARRKPGCVCIDGLDFRFPDAASFLAAYEEIFADRIYAFETANAAPLILDLGANVGLSVLFFKRLYPSARLIALEPDPEAFRYLENNVSTFGLTDVSLHNAAIWTETTDLWFAPNGADGGRLSLPGNGLRVPAMGICELLADRTVDFLKMDIEGAENDVLPACAHLLHNVRNLFVEYHSPTGEPQRLHHVIDALAAAGFRISLTTIKSPRSPFINRVANGAFNLQVNLSGFRP